MSPYALPLSLSLLVLLSSGCSSEPDELPSSSIDETSHDVSCDNSLDPDASTWRGPAMRALHLLDAASAVSLELKDDGRALWTIDGCDFWASGLASWAWRGGDIVLSPPPGFVEFYWVDRFTFRRHVERVQLSLASRSGDVVAEVHPREGREPFTQSWAPGLGCIHCCDHSVYACDQPIDTFWSSESATRDLQHE